MAEIVVKPVTNQQDWEQFITTRPEANFLHSWLWGAFQARLGRTICYSGFYREDQLVPRVRSGIAPVLQAQQ